MAQTEKTGDGVRAVERALDILLAFDSPDQALSVGELLKRVELTRPTLYRLLQTLEQKAFVLSSGNPQRFSLGPAMEQLARRWQVRPDVTTLAQPLMQRLQDVTGETVSLLVHQGNQRVCIAERPSHQPLSFKRGVGYREAIDRGASGRAILAFVADPASLLDTSMSPGQRRTFMAELTRVRKLGYATSKDELILGASAVAVPYYGPAGQVMGSLAVFGPTVRMDRSRIQSVASLLRQEARTLSLALGAA